MTDTMQAVVVYGPEDYRLERVPVPDPAPGELLVKVEAVGICASDLKCYHGAVKYWGDETRPATLDRNVIPGHEFVGTVAHVDDFGRQHFGVEIGDRVVSEQIVPCWQCRFCLRGQYWMCARHHIYGFNRATHGAMAEYMIFPSDTLVHKVSTICQLLTRRSLNLCRARCTPWNEPPSPSKTSLSSPDCDAWADNCWSGSPQLTPPKDRRRSTPDTIPPDSDH